MSPLNFSDAVRALLNNAPPPEGDLADSVREALEAAKDPGTSLSEGGGQAKRRFVVTHGGREFVVTVKEPNND